MPWPKPNKLHDELDALLDGRPVELTDELAPLAEAADELRVELAGLRLDPEVADRHLEQVLHGSAPVVQLPVRGQTSGWELRRRVVAVALAAALVLAPATIASAAALPGQAMYPFKLAIEQLRIASVQWSPPREAGERTRVAQERLEELNRLFELRMFSQIPTAVSALDKAVLDAQAAVSEAGQEGQPVPGVASTLSAVTRAGGQTLAKVVATVSDPSLLPKGTRDAIRAAVAENEVVLPPTRETASAGAPPSPTPTPTPATDANPGGGADPTTPTPPPSNTAQPPDPTQPTTPTTPTTTQPPPTSPPTTAPPPPTEATTPPASGGGGGGGAGAGAGADERAPSEQAPPTTLPAP